MNLGEPHPVDPAEALLRLIAWKYGEVQWLRAKVAVLEPETIAWGLSEHKEGFGPDGPVNLETTKAGPDVLWTMLREAEDQLADYASKALRAGVEERRVRIAEAQGEMVSFALGRIFERLELTASQQAMLPTVVPEELRKLGGAQ